MTIKVNPIEKSSSVLSNLKRPGATYASEHESLHEEGIYVLKINKISTGRFRGTDLATVTLEFKDGSVHIERYYFTKKNGSGNEDAVNAFFRLLDTVAGHEVQVPLTKKDLNKIIGKYIVTSIYHDEWDGVTRQHFDPYSMEVVNGFEDIDNYVADNADVEDSEEANTGDADVEDSEEEITEE